MRIFLSIEQRASGIPDAVAKLRFLRDAAERRRRRAHAMGRAVGIAGVVCVLVLGQPVTRGRSQAPLIRLTARPAAAASTAATVWLVEDSGGNRVYSNGLQVRTSYSVQSTPRRYRTFSHSRLQALPVGSAPSGIVFHTTESLIVPLEPGLNRALRRTREDVLEHVRRDRLYNFVVDRFGQVYAVVPEDQCAFHAGHSVWADRDRVYVDLNESFIGVSFEAQTDSVFAPSPAQLHAGRLLTEMLRSRYGIAEANCVTHAQVSVNPENMRLGYHTDWASNFPFRELGLTSGYSAPVPAVEVFGFSYDDHFLAAIGGRPWVGLTAAEECLVRDAEGNGMTAEQYRRHLQQQYKELRRHHFERAG